MDVDDKPGGITHAVLKEGLSASQENVTNMSLQNHPDSLPRKNKRSNDEDTRNLKSFFTKKGRHEDQDDSISQSSSGHDDEEASSPIERLSNAPNPIDDVEQPPTALLRDLETRAITVSQLIQEVKGIYAGLGSHSFSNCFTPHIANFIQSW